MPRLLDVNVTLHGTNNPFNVFDFINDKFAQKTSSF